MFAHSDDDGAAALMHIHSILFICLKITQSAPARSSLARSALVDQRRADHDPGNRDSRFLYNGKESNLLADRITSATMWTTTTWTHSTKSSRGLGKEARERENVGKHKSQIMQGTACGVTQPPRLASRNLQPKSQVPPLEGDHGFLQKKIPASVWREFKQTWWGGVVVGWMMWKRPQSDYSFDRLGKEECVAELKNLANTTSIFQLSGTEPQCFWQRIPYFGIRATASNNRLSNGQ